MIGFVSQLRERWREGQLQIWVASGIAHLLLLLLFYTIVLESGPPKQKANLTSELEEIKEEIQIEKIELEPLPIEQVPETTAEVEEVVPDVSEPTSTAVEELLTEADALGSEADDAAIASILTEAGSGAVTQAKGSGGSFDARGNKGMGLREGATGETELAVTAGLKWLERHQFPDGHWSINYTPMSKGPTTTGLENPNRKFDIGATSMGLLPYLAANYTHKQGPYQNTVSKALTWLIQNQEPKTGLFRAKGATESISYEHPLATMVICEAFGLTKDRNLREPAIQAVLAILQRQNKEGAWRYTYTAESDSDTSVMGWNMMALKSAAMAGLHDDSIDKGFDGVRKYLDLAGRGEHKGRFGYTPDNQNTSAPMTAVGILCWQYLGKGRNDNTIVDGVQYMLKTHPVNSNRLDCYYYYYATQVMHNYQGPEWDAWNRGMRRLWVTTQNLNEESTDFGSWDPEKFEQSHANKTGGRHYITCMGLLTLEVYYRYLPLYKIMKGSEEEMKVASSDK